jgi:toxin CptA
MRARVANDALAEGAVAGAAVVLLPGTTIWPYLLLLRLRSDDGDITLLPVLRDSVAPGAFRALAVALAAIGARSKR